MKFSKAMMLSLLGLFWSHNNVYAVVNQTQKKYEETTAECKVYYNSDTDFSVSIPKKITLDNDKTAEYSVVVLGDISSDTKIVVKPDSTFVMKDVSSSNNPKEDVVATITQTSTEWDWQEASENKKKTGKVSASKLSAGNWEGTFNFTISLRIV